MAARTTKKPTKPLPKGLRKIREYRGLTQEELADRIGVTQTAISMLELLDDPNPKWHTLRKLGRELDAPYDDIFPGEAQP